MIFTVIIMLKSKQTGERPISAHTLTDESLSSEPQTGFFSARAANECRIHLITF